MKDMDPQPEVTSRRLQVFMVPQQGGISRIDE